MQRIFGIQNIGYVLAWSKHETIQQREHTLHVHEIVIASAFVVVGFEAFYTRVYQEHTQSDSVPMLPKHYPTSALVGRVVVAACVSSQDFAQVRFSRLVDLFLP